MGSSLCPRTIGTINALCCLKWTGSYDCTTMTTGIISILNKSKIILDTLRSIVATLNNL